MILRLPVRRARRSRRGVALLMFCLLVFAFFAIAGLAIDMGMANLSQQEMQVATDTAALEGVRLRNAESQPTNSNTHRREKVSHQVRLVFDDDLQPTGNSWAVNDPEDNPAQYDDADHLHLGAGPGMQVPGPVGNQHIVTSSDASIWDDPVLRYNAPNQQYGDMVSGTYSADATHAEYGDTYQRPDFVAGTGGSGSAASKVLGLGFLVRMRRTSGIGATGGQNPYDTEPEVSYRARPVPFLFSLGSLMQGAAGGTTDPRQTGITVRATSIAVARPALRASAPPVGPDGTSLIPDEAFFPPILDQDGQPNPSHLAMLGLYPFAMPLQYWLSRVIPGPPEDGGTWHQPVRFEVQPDGMLLDMTTGEMAGKFAEYGVSVGQQIQPHLESSIRQVNGYVAIYADVAGPTGTLPRVIGYGFCHAQVQDPVAGSPTQIEFFSGIKDWGTGTMAEVQAWVAPNGASSRLDADAPAMSAPEWEFVFAQNRLLTYGPWADNPDGETTYDYLKVRHGSVLAPALAR